MEELLERYNPESAGSPLYGGLPPATEPPRRTVDVLDVLLIFLRHKWIIVVWTVVGILCGLFLLLRQPTLYSANSEILPPQQQQASSAVLGQLGVLANLGGAQHSSSDLYVALLQSRSVTFDMAERFHLQSVYKAPTLEIAAAVLGGRSKFLVNRDALIVIVVEDEKPWRAADLANGYVDELYRLNNRLAIGEAAVRRQFFEQQLAAEKDRLADAEVALKITQQTTGVLQLTGQTETVIRAVAEIQANITSHEVALSALRASSTEENPEVIRLRTELAGLRFQLQNLQKGKSSDGSVMSAAQLPAVGLEYIRKEREVHYHQTLFDLLARQLEAARIDEAKASPSIQVVDRAQIPTIKSWPSKGTFLAAGAIVGFVLGCMRCSVLFLYDYLDDDPRFHGRFVALKQAMRLRRS